MLQLENKKNPLMKFNRSRGELEEFFVFCVCVAGKNSDNTVRAVNKLLAGRKRPFAYLRRLLDQGRFIEAFKRSGLGQYNSMAKTFAQVTKSKIDLAKCSLDELEAIHGVGPKTSRFFLSFTRPKANVAILDVHILRWLREKGVDAPPRTPASYKQYRTLEAAFLSLARKLRKDPAKLDFEIWLKRRVRTKETA